MLRASHDGAVVGAGAELALVVVLPDTLVVRDFRAVVGCGCAAACAWEHLGVAVDVVLWRALVDEVGHGEWVFDVRGVLWVVKSRQGR